MVLEACFLLRRIVQGQTAVLKLIDRGLIEVDFRLSQEASRSFVLLERFSNVPMSLADACLVRMSELQPKSTFITIDSDFSIYRRNGQQVVPVLAPEGFA